MSDPMVVRIQDWLRAHEQDLVNDLIPILQIPSVEGDPLPNAPFGQANRDALDRVLAMGDAWGMKTKDLDGYVGYAEFGTGAKLITVLAHLDVVPVGPGWKHEPFGAHIDDGYLYARGAQDDKGPAIAAFYAAKALMECAPELGARVRCVFGCNEESGFRCLKYYAEREEPPTFGIAPDSGWPLYNAEKGIANFIVEAPLPRGDVSLLQVTGGQRPNIVIDTCDATVQVDRSARAYVVDKLVSSWDKNISTRWDGDVLIVKATGKAAHGASPYYGDSAAIRLFRFLREISPLPVQSAYDHLFEMANMSGEGLGLALADDPSGPLTSNLGIVTTANGLVKLAFNIRYPVTFKGDDIKARAEKAIAKLDKAFKLVDFKDSAPLYFPLDHPLVGAICEVYEAETGEKKEPGSMGGGTYARALPNSVSIGCGWEGDGPAHETDERIKVEHLFKMSRIYAHILWKLVNL